MPDSAKFNGPRAGFTITYTDAGGNIKTKQVRKAVRRTVLTNLMKWTEYSIKVSLSNSQYIGKGSSVTATTFMDGNQ